MVTTHTHIHSHTRIQIHQIDRCAHAHACTHSLPMGVDGATVTCGLNVSEEDTYTNNHSKKVHNTSRATFDKQIIPISRL